MASSDIGQTGSAVDRQRQKSYLLNAHYRGRVRTGCLTCRGRKVKCDENRPSCQNCTRMKKTCVYKTTKRKQPSVHIASISRTRSMAHEDNQNTQRTVPAIIPRQDDDDEMRREVPAVSHDNLSETSILETSPIENDSIGSDGPFPAPPDVHLSPPNCHTSSAFAQGDDWRNTDSSSTPFQLTSQHIYLTLALDLVPPELPSPISYSYFIKEVDCPMISAFDCLNWRRIKTHISQVGLQEISVATALLALQAVYRAQADRLPMSHASSLYQVAITNYRSVLDNNAIQFDILLLVAFLICLCVVTLPNEESYEFDGLNDDFQTRMEVWLLGDNHSPVSIRICAWLQLIGTSTKRSGNLGICSESVLNVLYDHILEPTSLSALDWLTCPSNDLYDIISTPLLTFYRQLQKISNRVTNIGHYRRSRITTADQAEVTDILSNLKASMGVLWDTRPGSLRLQPDELRGQFHRPISDPLIALAGVCITAYFSEIVAIGRTLGYPPVASPEAQQAMKTIRDVIDGDWNATTEHGLNPGYLRPLYFYAIEVLPIEEMEWAIDRLRQIRAPVSRSGFVASLAESLAEAQRNRGRRVTMKYFCYQTFNVRLPFM